MDKDPRRKEEDMGGRDWKCQVSDENLSIIAVTVRSFSSTDRNPAAFILMKIERRVFIN
jgi:hypothetical protein